MRYTFLISISTLFIIFGRITFGQTQPQQPINIDIDNIHLFKNKSTTITPKITGAKQPIIFNWSPPSIFDDSNKAKCNPVITPQNKACATTCTLTIRDSTGTIATKQFNIITITDLNNIIISQPSNIETLPTYTASFTVGLRETDGLYFTWQCLNAENDWEDIPTQKKRSYTIIIAVKKDTGQYRLKIFNGQDSIYSEPVKLKIKNVFAEAKIMPNSGYFNNGKSLSTGNFNVPIANRDDIVVIKFSADKKPISLNAAKIDSIRLKTKSYKRIRDIYSGEKEADSIIVVLDQMFGNSSQDLQFVELEIYSKIEIDYQKKYFNFSYGKVKGTAWITPIDIQISEDSLFKVMRPYTEIQSTNQKLFSTSNHQLLFAFTRNERNISLEDANITPVLSINGKIKSDTNYFKCKEKYYILPVNELSCKNGDIIKIDIKTSPPQTKSVYYKSSWELMGYKGIWFPVSIFMTDFKFNSQGIPIKPIPITVALGGKICNFFGYTSYLGISGFTNFSLIENEDEKYLSAFSIGALFDIDNYFYIGGVIIFNKDNNYNRKPAFVFGISTYLIHSLFPISNK